MPLTSPEDYARLGEHLKEIEDIFQRFLRESGYSDNTGALGRYPHRSAVLNGRICRKIDLQMEEDSEGHRFDTFFPDIPYTLWAGAWLDEGDLRFTAHRPSDANFVVFERLPYSQVRDIIGESLAQAARRLAGVTEASLKENGIRTKIRTS
jgi:hypothetical protein